MASGSSWVEPYFSVLAGSGAALAGLVFVAFARSAEQWRTNHLLNVIGLSTVAEFMAAVFVSIAQLAPDDQGRYAAIVVGAGGELLVLLYLRQDRKLGHNPLYGARVKDFLSAQRRLFVLSILAYGALIVGGVTRPSVGENVLAWTALWLVFSGSVEAWYFLDVGLEEGRGGLHERKS